MKTDLFQFYGHSSVFQICWDIECSSFIASSFRIWNSSTGIPSPPLALFLVMLPKAHLTSHSWSVALGAWSHHQIIWVMKIFLYSSVYSCHLFLMSSASVRSLTFLSFIEPIFEWYIPLVSLIFLKRSLVLPILLFSIYLHWSLRKSFLISLCYSLELCIQIGMSFLVSFAFHFSSFDSCL